MVFMRMEAMKMGGETGCTCRLLQMIDGAVRRLASCLAADSKPLSDGVGVALEVEESEYENV